jgi:glycolate oxidase iron-sulfur subunit
VTESPTAWPSDADLDRCVRCGFCLQACPTFVATGLETESPRGRLYLMRALAEDVALPTANVLGHLDQCLQCRNCEAVCPSGVPYGKVMEQTRARVLESKDAPLAWKARALFLREVIARPTRMRLFSSGLRFAQVSGLQALGERLPVVGERAILAPRIAKRPFTDKGLLADPPGATQRVAMLTGCIMPYAYPGVHRATVRVLSRNVCRVTAPASQVCCGALHAHAGDAVTARRLARANIDAFLAEKPDAIIVNSAGCGAAMKEYGELLAGDAAYRQKAHDFASRVRDVSEFLAELPFDPPAGSVDAVVTYQDSCHLAHAQRITRAPRTLLESIPGVRFVEMARPDRCCGSAGVYSLTQPEMSLELLDGKMADVGATGASIVATANPGCMSQLETGARREGLPVRVVHVVQLLDRAYRAG